MLTRMFEKAGSSPRVRGTHIGAGARLARVRFIPAGAGNASSSSMLKSCHSVHPRGCGERAFHCVPRGANDGSSPRVRGTQEVDNALRDLGRFIPAGAGNARGHGSGFDAAAVHPRGCGERVQLSNAALIESGSSPRVRGTL